MSKAFDLLDPNIQKVVYKTQWERFHPFQEEVISHLMLSPSDMVVSAPTASGKTEAVFLPLLSQIAHGAGNSVNILYVSPLKALINDQYRRIENLCAYLDFPITKWHGDASPTGKNKLTNNPSGILLITPESIEAFFQRKFEYLGPMFGSLKYVVIDEIHSFLENPRGVHLRSLLNRIEYETHCNPHIIGLSATVGEPKSIAEWIRPKNPEKVKIVAVLDYNKGLRGGINTVQIPPLPEDKESVGTITEFDKQLFKVICTGKNLIFANHKDILEWSCDCMHIIAKKNNLPDNFFIHHGSLSKYIRETTEEFLKQSRNVSVFCTSSLELGIDIGDIDKVVFLEPPYQVSSLIQRLGRSGRKAGRKREFRFILPQKAEKEIQAGIPNINFQLEQVACIAMVELMLEGWSEPLSCSMRDISTFIHQILSFLGQTGGAKAKNIFHVIGQVGFNSCYEQNSFIDILRNLKEKEIIYQQSDGKIALTNKGEQIVGHYDFFAAFSAPKQWTVIYKERVIGEITSDSIPIMMGSVFLLAGCRWVITGIVHSSSSVLVSIAHNKKGFGCSGAAGLIHSEIHQKMKAIYEKKTIPSFLSQNAAKLLKIAFEQYDSFVRPENSLFLEIFAGSKIQNTLWTFLNMEGIDSCISVSDVLLYSPLGRKKLISNLKQMDFDSFDKRKMLTIAEGVMHPKFVGFIPENLFIQSYFEQQLDIQGTKLFCKNL